MSFLPARRLTACTHLVVSGLLLFAVAEGCGGDDTKKKAPPAAGGTAGKGGSAGGAGTGPGGEAGAPAAGGVGGSGGDEPGGSAGATSGGEAGNGGAAAAGGASDGGAGGATPSGPLRALSVTAGFWTSFVVQVGTRQVWSWGYQVDPVTGGFNAAATSTIAPVRLQGLTGVDQVVVVSETSSYYARHTDGTVSAWGRNTQGQLGDQTTTDRPMPVKVLDIDGTPMRGVCSIAGGHGLLIMARAPQCSTYAPGSEPADTIRGAWVVGLFTPGAIGGTNATGFPFNGAIARQFPGLPAGVEVASMAMPDAAAASSAGVVFFMSDGSEYAWGYNGSGTNQLGAGISTTFAGDATTAVDVTSFWAGVARAEIGRTFSIALNADGTLSGVGRNLEGQLGTDNDVATNTLGPVLSISSVTAFSVGQVNVVAITSGQLWAWGWDGLGPVDLPTRLGALDGFTHVSLGDDHGLAIGPDQRVYVWGGRSYGALGDGILSGRASTPALLAE